MKGGGREAWGRKTVTGKVCFAQGTPRAATSGQGESPGRRYWDIDAEPFPESLAGLGGRMGGVGVEEAGCLCLQGTTLPVDVGRQQPILNIFAGTH